MRRRGFTLIELMIVIAIIAIIAAIAIPSILAAIRAANERNASGSLRQMSSVEITFKTSDFDQNGINDYWVGDVAGLHFTTVTGSSRIALIELSVALADGDSNSGWTGFRASPKSGYWYCAQTGYSSGGAAVNFSGNLDVDRFAFLAYPNSYGSSGRLLFIVNEGGTMYKKDPGSEAAFASDTASGEAGAADTSTTLVNGYGVFPSDPMAANGGGGSVGPWSKLE
jgi:prepilin-type N-terminal cleavage/methylation domain-containing protein